MISKGKGFTVLGRHEGRAVAGAVYLHSGKKGIYKFGASDLRFQRLRANNLVMWEAIRWFSKNGFEELCFGRTEPENAGLVRFKAGWGAEASEVLYYRFDIPSGKTLKHTDSRIFDGYYHRIPAPIFKLLGSLLYRLRRMNRKVIASQLINRLYYNVRPAVPRKLQIALRRIIASRKLEANNDIWPIYPGSEIPPVGWPGWPENKKFALVLTHDIETIKGQSRCLDVVRMEKDLNFRSAFNFVAERYPVSAELRNFLVAGGFEVGVHGLYHDGKKFKSRKIFNERAPKINHYLREWNASGFRSPAMYCNLDWLHDLNIKYDCSTFDTDPFEPQATGVGTIFPFFVQGRPGGKGYVELPYTLAQDLTLFVILEEQSIDIWKHKLDWIAQKAGWR